MTCQAKMFLLSWNPRELTPCEISDICPFGCRLTKAVAPHGSSYEGELEAIKLRTDVKNICNARSLFMYSDSESSDFY